MPANLKEPFSESCCDGGECAPTLESCQPCGCDPKAKWVCQRHQIEAEAEKKWKDEYTFGR
jgi:hypothetical protein